MSHDVGGVREGAPRAGWRAVTLAGVAVGLAVCARVLLAPEGPELVYGLDDPYIHLAVARSFLEHGVWGVDGVHAASATSSLLWPLLLAACGALVGVTDRLPFAINAVASLAMAAWLHDSIAGSGPRRTASTWACLIFGGVPALWAGGMEHVLQAWLALIWLAGLERERASPVWTGLVAAALFAVRLEALALVVPGLLVLAGRRQGRAALAGVVGVLVAGAAFVAVDLACGGHLLPNSVVAKKTWFNPAHGLTGRAWLHMQLVGRHTPSLLLATVGLIGVLPVLLRAADRPARRSGVALLVGLALQVAVGTLGWFFRYEAWLFVAFAWWVARHAEALRRSRAVIWTLPVPWWGAALLRAGVALAMIPSHVGYVHGLHVRLGRLAAELGQPVAANDIGAVAFYGRVPVVDLVGLGNNDVLEALLAGRRDADFLDRLTRDEGVGWAAVFPSWVSRVPARWSPVGGWRCEDPPAGEAETRFYAVGLLDEAFARAWSAAAPAPGWAPIPVHVDAVASPSGAASGLR